MEDDIDGFDCGLPVVNNWLRNQLKNAGRQHTAVAYATFSNGVLAGFYTLSAYGINHTEANGWLKRNSPDPIPAILLGMLGVDIRYQTMHIGSQLLRDATLRASNAAEIVGAKALFVEPASDSATKFYEHYGFRHIERSTKMFLPLKRNRVDFLPVLKHRKEVNRPSRTGLAPHAGQPIPLASHSAAVRFDWKMPWLPLMPVACHMCFRLIVSRRRVPTV